MPSCLKRPAVCYESTRTDRSRTETRRGVGDGRCVYSPGDRCDVRVELRVEEVKRVGLEEQREFQTSFRWQPPLHPYSNAY